MPDGKPNILVIWGDDIGITNLSCYSDGLMGYRTPNIDRIANEGMRFTDSYGEQSCTAGRSSFITGQSVFRTGLSKVGVPAAPVGLQKEDPTIAELLKPLGYATGQFGKNHLGDRNEFATRPSRSSHPAQGDQRRVVPLRGQLLPSLPARGAAAAADRHRHEPYRLPVPATGARKLTQAEHGPNRAHACAVQRVTRRLATTR
jgi:arylsulfatase A-like enzyme